MEIPDGLKWLEWVAGSEYPDGDPERMRRLAEYLRIFADGLNRTALLVDEAEKAAVDAYPAGAGIDQIISRFVSMRKSLEEQATFANSLAVSVDGVATEIEYGQWMMITSLALLAGEIAIAWMFPATAPGVEAAAIAGARFAIREIAQRVLTSVERWVAKLVGERVAAVAVRHVAINMMNGVVPDLAIQLRQIGSGHRDGVDWGRVTVDVVSAAAGAAVAGPLGEGMGNVLGSRLPSSWFGTALNGGLTGAGAGFIGAGAGFIAGVAAQFGIDVKKVGWDQAIANTNVDIDPRMVAGGMIGGALSGSNKALSMQHYLNSPKYRTLPVEYGVGGNGQGKKPVTPEPKPHAGVAEASNDQARTPLDRGARPAGGAETNPKSKGGSLVAAGPDLIGGAETKVGSEGGSLVGGRALIGGAEMNVGLKGGSLAAGPAHNTAEFTAHAGDRSVSELPGGNGSDSDAHSGTELAGEQQSTSEHHSAVSRSDQADVEREQRTNLVGNGLNSELPGQSARRDGGADTVAVLGHDEQSESAQYSVPDSQSPGRPAPAWSRGAERPHRLRTPEAREKLESLVEHIAEAAQETRRAGAAVADLPQVPARVDRYQVACDRENRLRAIATAVAWRDVFDAARIDPLTFGPDTTAVTEALDAAGIQPGRDGVGFRRGKRPELFVLFRSPEDVPGPDGWRSLTGLADMKLRCQLVQVDDFGKVTVVDLHATDPESVAEAHAVAPEKPVGGLPPEAEVRVLSENTPGQSVAEEASVAASQQPEMRQPTDKSTQSEVGRTALQRKIEKATGVEPDPEDVRAQAALRDFYEGQEAAQRIVIHPPDPQSFPGPQAHPESRYWIWGGTFGHEEPHRSTAVVQTLHGLDVAAEKCSEGYTAATRLLDSNGVPYPDRSTPLELERALTKYVRDESADRHRARSGADSPENVPGRFRARRGKPRLENIVKLYEAVGRYREAFDNVAALRRKAGDVLVQRVLDAAGLRPHETATNTVREAFVAAAGGQQPFESSTGAATMWTVFDTDGSLLSQVGYGFLPGEPRTLLVVSTDLGSAAGPVLRQELADRGIAVRYVHVSVDDSDLVHAIEMRPPTVDAASAWSQRPLRISQLVLAEPGDWTPGWEWTHVPEAPEAHERLQSLGADLAAAVTERKAEQRALAALPRRSGFDPKGSTPRERYEAESGYLTAELARIDRAMGRYDVTQEQMDQFDARRAELLLERKKLLDTFGRYSAAVYSEDRLRQEVADEAMWDMVNAPGGLPRSKISVTAYEVLGAGGFGLRRVRLLDRETLLVVSAVSEHLAWSDLRRDLAGLGLELQIWQVRVDNSGRVLVTEMHPPTDTGGSSIPAVMPNESVGAPSASKKAPIAAFQHLDVPQHPDLQLLSDRLKAERTSAAARRDHWLNSRDNLVEELNVDPPQLESAPNDVLDELKEKPPDEVSVDEIPQYRRNVHDFEQVIKEHRRAHDAVALIDSKIKMLSGLVSERNMLVHQLVELDRPADGERAGDEFEHRAVEHRRIREAIATIDRDISTLVDGGTAREYYNRLLEVRNAITQDRDLHRVERDKLAANYNLRNPSQDLGLSALSTTIDKLRSGKIDYKTVIVGEGPPIVVSERTTTAEMKLRERAIDKLQGAADRFTELDLKVHDLDRRIGVFPDNEMHDSTPAVLAELDWISAEHAHAEQAAEPLRARLKELAAQLGVPRSRLGRAELPATIAELRKSVPGAEVTEHDQLARLIEIAEQMIVTDYEIGMIRDRMMLLAGAGSEYIESVGGRMVTKEVGLVGGSPARIFLLVPQEGLEHPRAGLSPGGEAARTRDAALAKAFRQPDTIVEYIADRDVLRRTVESAGGRMINDEVGMADRVDSQIYVLGPRGELEHLRTRHDSALDAALGTRAIVLEPSDARMRDDALVQAFSLRETTVVYRQIVTDRLGRWRHEDLEPPMRLIADRNSWSRDETAQMMPTMWLDGDGNWHNVAPASTHLQGSVGKPITALKEWFEEFPAGIRAGFPRTFQACFQHLFVHDRPPVDQDNRPLVDANLLPRMVGGGPMIPPGVQTYTLPGDGNLANGPTLAVEIARLFRFRLRGDLENPWRIRPHAEGHPWFRKSMRRKLAAVSQPMVLEDEAWSQRDPASPVEETDGMRRARQAWEQVQSWANKHYEIFRAKGIDLVRISDNLRLYDKEQVTERANEIVDLVADARPRDIDTWLEKMIRRQLRTLQDPSQYMTVRQRILDEFALHRRDDYNAIAERISGQFRDEQPGDARILVDEVAELVHWRPRQEAVAMVADRLAGGAMYKGQLLKVVFTLDELKNIEAHLLHKKYWVLDYFTGDKIKKRLDAVADVVEALHRLIDGVPLPNDILMLNDALAEYRYLDENPGARWRDADNDVKRLGWDYDGDRAPAAKWRENTPYYPPRRDPEENSETGAGESESESEHQRAVGDGSVRRQGEYERRTAPEERTQAEPRTKAENQTETEIERTEVAQQQTAPEKTGPAEQTHSRRRLDIRPYMQSRIPHPPRFYSFDLPSQLSPPVLSGPLLPPGVGPPRPPVPAAPPGLSPGPGISPNSPFPPELPHSPGPERPHSPGGEPPSGPGPSQPELRPPVHPDAPVPPNCWLLLVPPLPPLLLLPLLSLLPLLPLLSLLPAIPGFPFPQWPGTTGSGSGDGLGVPDSSQVRGGSEGAEVNPSVGRGVPVPSDGGLRLLPDLPQLPAVAGFPFLRLPGAGSGSSGGVGDGHPGWPGVVLSDTGSGTGVGAGVPGVPLVPPFGSATAAGVENRRSLGGRRWRQGGGVGGAMQDRILVSPIGFGALAEFDPVTGELCEVAMAVGGVWGVYGDFGGVVVVFYRGVDGLGVRVGDQVIDLDDPAIGVVWSELGSESRFVVTTFGVVVGEFRYPVVAADADLGLLIRDVLSDPVRRDRIFTLS
ncbi:hypothetical protein ACQP1G_17330 [Nocardia sp. CA-107356]|uniref:WXG100-like domain-containing protein n=1 Tax=Nocardia sp. CA-107356 TaxID=3239972 RepID=UPI003D92CE67